jgi:mono/diheme cytochrome c family protein
MRRLAIALFCACSVPVGCGAQDSATSTVLPPGPAGPLTLRPIEWNAAKADVGAVSAVTEAGDAIVLFGTHGATVITGGAITATVAGETSWTTAATIPAADGIGSWVLGVDGKGRVRRLRAGSAFEDVSDRYGLGKDVVRSVVQVDTLGTMVAFGWAGGFAIADGKEVTRWDAGTTGELAGARGRLAWIETGEVRTFDVAKKTVTRWPLPDAARVAFDDQGRMVVAAKRAVWMERAGALQLRWTQTDGDISAIATAGSRVWLLVGSELAVVEGETIAASSGAALEPDARLFGASNGDVWTVSTKATRRFAREAGDAAHLDWDTNIKPIFAKVCSSCHQPGGTSGVDLSTHDTWMAKRASLRQRVMVAKTMPPATKDFSEADRATIGAWLDRSGG